MSNAHASKTHGLTTMNTTRPKSLLRKRNNKHRSVAKKIAIMEERKLAMKALSKGQKLPAAPTAKPEAKAEKETKTPVKKAPAKKPTAPKKPRATKKAA